MTQCKAPQGTHTAHRLRSARQAPAAFWQAPVPAASALGLPFATAEMEAVKSRKLCSCQIVHCGQKGHAALCVKFKHTVHLKQIGVKEAALIPVSLYDA